MSAFDKQVDGSHYKDQVIQPFELAYLVAGGDAGFCKFVKYLTRDKGDRKVNLEKAIHIVQLTTEIVDIYNITPVVLTPQITKILQVATNTLTISNESDMESPEFILLGLYAAFITRDFKMCIEILEEMLENLDGS